MADEEEVVEQVLASAITKNNNDDDDEIKNGFIQIQSVQTSKQDRILLHPMEIEFPEGAVTVIMGPSGSGKTTLLNFLTDNNASNVLARGDVALEGTPAFIPQDDRLHGFYTCQSYLKHYCRLSGREIDEDEIHTLLSSLGLSNQANTLVGDIFLRGLSGGQKRRLSVGLEALSKPQLFFLDEPTSGLDAESAYQVMRFLHDYARGSGGRRVILTIHQPSSFIWQLVDNVVLLSKGKLIYQGSRRDIECFFNFAGYPTPAEYNPADHYVTAVNDEFTNHAMAVDEWAQKYVEYTKSGRCTDARRTSEIGSRSSLRASIKQARRQSIVRTDRTGFLPVALELTKRYFLNLWFNPGILGTRMAMYAMLALMIGILFFDLGSDDDYQSIQSRIALSFYCVAFFVFMSVAVLPFTVIERAIVEKEVANKYYHPAVYQIAQALSSIPGCALLAFLTTVIVISMTGLREPLWYFLNMFLSLVCAEALCQLVSHMVPHFIIGMALVAGIYGMFMLLQGFMLVPSAFPNWLRWSYNIAFHTYAWRSFMYSEFGDDSVTFAPDNGNNPFQTGWQVLESYEIEDVNRGNDMIVLLCYAAIIHFFSFVTLHAKHNMFRSKINPPILLLEGEGEGEEMAPPPSPAGAAPPVVAAPSAAADRED